MDALVIGCGVIGLTTAIRLQDAGYRVAIRTRALPPETTSAVAAAVWYPYRAYPRERVLAWSRRTLDVLYDLAGDPATGVHIRTLREFFDRPWPDPWWRDGVRRFKRMPPEARPSGYADGFVIEVPVVETPVYLRYLFARFRDAGGRIEQVPEGVSDLYALTREAPAVVNCTGLGARALLGDEALYPIRGQIVRVTNPGLEDCLIEEHGPLAMTYIIPRTHDCILGGTADEGAWDTTPDDAITAGILRKARQLEPRLADAAVLEVRVGLRPARPTVRLERETTDTGTLLHNYGHGGSGYTLAWGCADDVLALAEKPTPSG